MEQETITISVKDRDKGLKARLMAIAKKRQISLSELIVERLKEIPLVQTGC